MQALHYHLPYVYDKHQLRMEGAGEMRRDEKECDVREAGTKLLS